MAKPEATYADLVRMAKTYGVEKNALFLQAIKQYAIQQKVIDMIEAAIDDDSLTSEKTYIAGTANEYAAPLVKELPKHSDAANKTAQIILNIITTLGKEKQEEKPSRLSAMLTDE